MISRRRFYAGKCLNKNFNRHWIRAPTRCSCIEIRDLGNCQKILVFTPQNRYHPKKSVITEKEGECYRKGEGVDWFPINE